MELTQYGRAERASIMSSGVTAAAIRSLLACLALVVAISIVAGRWDWTAGWGFVGMWAVTSVSYMSIVQHMKSQLSRSESVPEAAEKPRSRPSTFTYLYLCLVIIGVLDGGRFGWSTMPAAFWFVGAALYVAAFVVFGWCAAINPYFGTANRIRPEESGHLLISTGPYTLVRHPGYFATMTGYLFGTALMLHSWWACVPAVLGALRLCFAAATEDRILLQTLAGYRAYAERVPYRLFPGIW
jgi:protein-S-isoprenylcysteine O-methyltransferase Ste14